ncbi:zeta toxin family protein [Thiotrichales bacterium 19S11-10]|nr:zeta toxin family protein [Thiotrichales bacterium 19S11-10]MCF6808284.1 zeta toxin family protein [Thiotrichales bacterium 19S9-11]MCF6812300.1 zeta toxin family protein [Thiotrichales bacterium 19S9-12]
MNHGINQALIDKVQLNYKTQPLACFLIGANGSGKSTLRSYLDLSEVQTNIDPDALNRIAQYKQVDNFQTYAAKQAISLYDYALTNDLNVCMESTLAGKGTIKRIRRAKASGYYLIGYFVGINDVLINIERVRFRVEKGGHHIEEHLIRKRYDESIDNLLKVYDDFDELHIIDNSDAHYQLQASNYNDEIIQYADTIEPWANKILS